MSGFRRSASVSSQHRRRSRKQLSKSPLDVADAHQAVKRSLFCGAWGNLALRQQARRIFIGVDGLKRTTGQFLISHKERNLPPLSFPSGIATQDRPPLILEAEMTETSDENGVISTVSNDVAKLGKSTSARTKEEPASTPVGTRERRAPLRSPGRAAERQTKFLRRTVLDPCTVGCHAYDRATWDSSAAAARHERSSLLGQSGLTHRRTGRRASELGKDPGTRIYNAHPRPADRRRASEATSTPAAMLNAA